MQKKGKNKEAEAAKPIPKARREPPRRATRRQAERQHCPCVQTSGGPALHPMFQRAPPCPYSNHILGPTTGSTGPWWHAHPELMLRLPDPL